MYIGVIGLGKMGLNLVKNMTDHQISVTAFDVNQEALNDAVNSGATVVNNIQKLIAELPAPRIIWLMVPAGSPTEKTVTVLAKSLSDGDIVIDGGNSYFQDSIRRHDLLAQKGIHFFDCGTSGGKAGARHDGNFMIGGDEAEFAQIEPLFKAIAQEDGYLFTGKSGSGHYLKMIHNGIEYGMMQAIGEGFDVLKHSQYNYDNQAVAKVWNHGSVIRGWLMELAEDSFRQDPNLNQIKGVMHSSGEGAWTVEEAIKLHVPTPVITSALMMRYRSEQDDTMTGKVVAALRHGFGGHAVDHLS